MTGGFRFWVLGSRVSVLGVRDRFLPAWPLIPAPFFSLNPQPSTLNLLRIG